MPGCATSREDPPSRNAATLSQCRASVWWSRRATTSWCFDCLDCITFLVALSADSILAKAYTTKDTGNSCRENEPPPPASPSDGLYQEEDSEPEKDNG